MVESDTSMTLYAGVNDRFHLNASTVQERSSVLMRTYGKSYYSIALIKVNASFTMINGVAMASITTNGFRAVEDNVCNSGSYGVQLNNATKMKFIEFELGTCRCHNWLKKHLVKELVDDWICRQNEVAVKICQGDLGLGMMCDGRLQAVCIGIEVFEDENTCKAKEHNLEKCGQNNSMGLFIDICYYIDWIGTFVSSIDQTRSACDSSSAAPNTPATPKWLTWSLFLAFVNFFKIIFFQR